MANNEKHIYVKLASYDSDGFEKKDSSGNQAGNVVIGGGGINFSPSSYTGDISAADAGTAVAMATGATKVQLQNFTEAVTTSGAVIAFGATSAAAIINLDIATNVSRTGTILLGTVADVMMGSDKILDIPANARDGGYMAIGNRVASDNHTIRVTQGI